MNGPERRDPNHTSRRRGDLAGWLDRRANTLAVALVALFAVLAVLSIGIAATSNTAERALELNETAGQRARMLRVEIRRFTERNADLIESNDDLVAQIAALRRQVEDLGAVPVTVTVEDRRGNAGPDPPAATTTTSTTAPPPPTSTTTTTACDRPVRAKGVCAPPRR